MEEALAKIRPHTSSNLPHQKTPATLLVALESTLDDQKADKTPVAYFATLLTTLEATIQKKDVKMGDGDVLPAELYLLALVIPFVSTSVLRTHLTTLLSLTSPLFPLVEDHAPPLKSQLAIFDTILTSLDRSQLDTPGIRQSFMSIVQLCIDKRPKVRRKAVEVVDHVLSNPPTPLARHPYSEKVAAWIQSTFEQLNSYLFSKSKSSSDPTDMAIHLLTFVRPVLLHLPPSVLPGITTAILGLPRFGTPYLSQSAYSTLSNVFSAAAAYETNAISSQVNDVLKAVLSSPPLQTDTILAPAWIEVVGNAMLAYHAIDASGSEAELEKIWMTIFAFLQSADGPTRKSAVKTLETLTGCFTPSLTQRAAKDPSSPVATIVTETTKALASLPYVRAIPDILAVQSTLFLRIGLSAKSILVPAVEKIGAMRTKEKFEYKEDADRALGAAMRALGPDVILGILPLNLDDEDRQAKRVPRAFLLPLLSQPHICSIKFFVSYFVPLSERMFDSQQKADAEGRQSESKVWSVFIAQIWAGLPYFDWTSPDLSQALDQRFSALLSQLLYNQRTLRPPVFKALKTAVESNVARTKPQPDGSSLSIGVSPEQAQKNIDFLATQAENWLAVVFNVFGSVDRDQKPMAREVISAWASICGEKEISQAFGKVLQLFKQNLATHPAFSKGNPSNEGSVTSMMQDILIILLPYISTIDTQTLYDAILTSEVLGNKDNGVQKRGYKLLVKILETGRIQVEPEAVLKQLDEFSDSLSAAAKKNRFDLLALLMQTLPSSAMHVIPSLIPEAVLGTKEPSEKARMAAFDFVIAMGKKMSEGGVVKRGMMDTMDEDVDVDSEVPADAAASIEEYMTMVSGGLAGASPHMISATVTAISRLLFEFKGDISEQMQDQILSTMLVFLGSNNREIVKSVLGFIKLCIHTLSLSLIRPHLPQLVPGLLNWSHDHKNHFKAKVRHIFERMLRRLKWEEIYACVGETDEDKERGKVLVNIKKRKDRAKRKKAARDEAEDGEDERPAQKRSGDAFEDVVYGSESELEDSDEDEAPVPAQKGQAAANQKRKKDAGGGARIRMDVDEPMDLLEGAALHISNSKGSRSRKPGQDASHFKTDEETGKMILDDSSDEEAVSRTKKGGDTTDVAGEAYRESITGVDGFTRGPNGRVKFNKDTKKRRRQELEAADMDVDMEDAAGTKAQGGKKAKQNKIGHEFKAKKAGGDVKKGGVDPYAYMPLSQAAKKNHGGKARLGIAGK